MLSKTINTYYLRRYLILSDRDLTTMTSMRERHQRDDLEDVYLGVVPGLLDFRRKDRGSRIEWGILRELDRLTRRERRYGTYMAALKLGVDNPQAHGELVEALGNIKARQQRLTGLLLAEPAVFTVNKSGSVGGTDVDFIKAHLLLKGELDLHRTGNDRGYKVRWFGRVPETAVELPEQYLSPNRRFMTKRGVYEVDRDGNIKLLDADRARELVEPLGGKTSGRIQVK
jgi:hypothetical protein